MAAGADKLKPYEAEIGPASDIGHIDFSKINWSNGCMIRSTNWLGDALMTLPGCYRIFESVPKGIPRIILCPAKLAAFWNAVPWIDTVISFAGKRLSKDEIAALKELQPDATVILPNSFGAAWDIWRAKLPSRIGRSGRGRGLLLDHKLPEWKRQPGQDNYHQVRHYLELAAACGASSWGTDYPSLQPRDTGIRERENLSGDYLIVAPGAAYGPAKQWPAENYRRVAEWWAADHGRVVSIGAPGEEAVAEKVVQNIPGALSLAGKTTMAELIDLLAGAKAICANDSGAMHLGAGLGKAGVAIFGSTEPLATGPLGGTWYVLREKIFCSPCLQRECYREDEPYECLKKITPEIAIDALRCILNK